MEKKSRTSRENAHALFSTKSNCNLTASRLMATHKQDKAGAKSKPIVEAQPQRNFRFSKNAEQNVKKTYQKNSDKTIKPPGKQNRQFGNASDGRSITSGSFEDKAVLQRGDSQISNHTAYLATGKRSITDNFESHILASFKRVDTKTIDDLEKRLENLQSILLRKIEILKTRNPEKLKKEYKFIALIVDDESKLIVKHNDAKCFPDFLPAKSLEDLNRKAREFFLACLLSFVDKLRFYQDEGRSINCNEIFEDLKKEENDYCNILQDWISDFCDETDETLIPVKQATPIIPSCHQEVQTVDEQVELDKNFADEISQTDFIDYDAESKTKDLNAKMDNLRLKNYELRDQMEEQKESFKQEIERLKQKQKEKLSDLMDSWQKEICEKNHKDEIVTREQRLNEDLSQQVIDLRERLNDLTDKHEELMSEQKKDEDIKSELERLRKEHDQIQVENLELQELKSHFLKKLDQRYMRIELQDKEIKLQKRTLQTKSEEIEQLKKQFDAKVKENRQNKESLEARNKLIDHLRNAIEIDQKKIREYEVLLESKSKSSENVEEEQETDRDLKLKRVKSKSTHTSRIKSSKRGTTLPSTDFSRISTYQPFDADLIATAVRTNEESHGSQKHRRDRSKKKDRAFSEQDATFDIKTFKEAISADNSSEVEKSPVRNVKPRRRTRDIVVKKYEV